MITPYEDFAAAGMIVKINSESRFIENYHFETGEIILDSVFKSRNSSKHIERSIFKALFSFFDIACLDIPHILAYALMV